MHNAKFVITKLKNHFLPVSFIFIILKISITYGKDLPFKQVVFFGDSLTDQGNNSWVKHYGVNHTNSAGIGAPITNKSFIDNKGHKIGKTWAQFLSTDLFKKEPLLSSKLPAL